MPKLIVLLSSFATLGCASMPLPAPPVAAPRPDGEPGVIAGARAVIDLANAARADFGLQPLREDPLLTRAADEYAQELAERRELSHTSPTPGRHIMTQRIEAAGAKWLNAAENLASTSRTLVHVPREAIDMWLSSPGHRSNMLDARYLTTGVGIARDRFGAWYIVQLYVTPRR